MNPAASASPRASERRDYQVPLWRLYLLRAAGLLGLYGLLPTIVRLFDHAPDERGMLTAMVSGLWVMGFLVIRYPLQMLPIFLFEFAWKSIWALSFGIPQWAAGRVDPQLSKDLFDIGLFAVVFGLLIPWRHVWLHYIKQPSERWR
jgi:hypothetical protein